MSTQILDGKEIGARVREQVRVDTAAFVEATGITPGLATVLVGDNKASATYVRMKRKGCAKAGITSFHHEVDGDITQEGLLELVAQLNNDPAVHGILVQLPLPKHIEEKVILDAIVPNKDVDGFHPFNIGRLAMANREPDFIPATPSGVMVMLDEVGVDLSGLEAVVVGRSNIVGRPMAMLLLNANATVTICHSRTKDLAAHTRNADIVIAAVGIANFITGDMIKPGATVIDVGINSVPDDTKKRGYRLVGDVDYDSALPVAGAITPVPGGVGPMTIALLLRNTLKAAQATS